MVKIIIYALGALAIMGAIVWGINSLINVGKQEQAAKDAPIIAGLTRQRDEAIAANKSLNADIDNLQAAVNRQNASLEALDAAQHAAEAAAKAAIAKARTAEQVARDNAETARLTAIATAPPDNSTELQDCEEARGILSDLARHRRMQ